MRTAYTGRLQFGQYRAQKRSAALLRQVVSFGFRGQEMPWDRRTSRI